MYHFHVLPTILDKKMAKILQRELEDNGVKVITSERIEKIVGSSNTDGDVKVIKTNTNRQINPGFILLGTSVMSNSDRLKMQI